MRKRIQFYKISLHGIKHEAGRLDSKFHNWYNLPTCKISMNARIIYSDEEKDWLQITSAKIIFSET